MKLIIYKILFYIINFSTLKLGTKVINITYKINKMSGDTSIEVYRPYDWNEEDISDYEDINIDVWKLDTNDKPFLLKIENFSIE